MTNDELENVLTALPGPLLALVHAANAYADVAGELEALRTIDQRDPSSPDPWARVRTPQNLGDVARLRIAVARVSTSPGAVAACEDRFRRAQIAYNRAAHEWARFVAAVEAGALEPESHGERRSL
jgi:hypothetical protein